MAVAFDAVGPAGGAGTVSNASPLTWTHVNNGNCILILFVNSNAASNPATAVTYGGVTIPLLGYQQNSNSPNGGCALYGLAGATVPTGSNTVSVTFTTGAGDMQGGTVSLSGVTSLGTAAKFTNPDGTSASTSVSVPGTTIGGMVVAAAGYGGDGGGGSFTGTNSVTVRVNDIFSSSSPMDNSAMGTVASAGGAQTVGFSAIGADWWTIVAVEAQAPAAAAGPIPVTGSMRSIAVAVPARIGWQGAQHSR